jgi:hypothetical protein
MLLAIAMAACGGGSSTPVAGKDLPAADADVATIPDLGPADAREVPPSEGTCTGDACGTLLDVLDRGGGEAEDPGADVPDDGTPVCNGVGGFLCPCATNDDCMVNFCVRTGDGKECTKTCIEETDCPSGWACVAVQNTGGDLIYVCNPLGINQCRPCSKNGDCAADLGTSTDRCISLGGKGDFCATACDASTPCPAGSSCSDANVVGGGTSKQCVPDSGDCTCSQDAITAGASTTCYVTNAAGTCQGQRTCQAGGLTDCNARTPAPDTCATSGVDDNCDGVTDPPGSIGCVTYYPDNDGDGYGIGLGSCLCNNPGPGYVTVGGDCNDANSGVNPGATEICNGIDDNCDGVTDPAGSKGCATYYMDEDGDGYAASTDSQCLCSPEAPYTATKLGDCDDHNATICPDSTQCPEICDGLDNDCDGRTDWPDARGCQAYYYDGDKDGYGVTSNHLCLCTNDPDPPGIPAGYTTQDANDCNDNDPTIHPNATEICNGKDDNCNGQTDEGDIATLCPAPPGVDLHGTIACGPPCEMGACDVATTNGGVYVPAWYDLDGNESNGCECQADANEALGGQSCNTAIDLGTITDAPGLVSPAVTGNLAPANDEDWYQVNVVDTQPAGGDTFNFVVKFLNGQNAGGTAQIDVFRGSCSSQICSGGQETEWATNFSATSAGVSKGENPCSTVQNVLCDSPTVGDGSNATQTCLAKEGTPENCGPCPGFSVPDQPGPPDVVVHVCTDNSAKFLIRVYRDPTQAPSCAPYVLEISNGLYGFSGQSE